MNKILKKLLPLAMVMIIVMFMCPGFAYAEKISRSVEYKVEVDGKPTANNGHIDKTSQSWMWNTSTESASITPTCTATAKVGEYDFDKWVVSGTNSLSEDWATKDDSRTVYLVNGNPEVEGEIILVAKYKKHVEEKPEETTEEGTIDNTKESNNVAKTGDVNKMTLWIIALAAAVVIIIVLVSVLTRKKK